MPLRTGVPRTTHTWLKALYNYLDLEIAGIYPSGASGIPNATWVGKGVAAVQIGNASGIIGLYGSTGLARPTGLGATAGTTGLSGFDLRSNGGTGTQFYSLNDLVAIMKSRGDITV